MDWIKLLNQLLTLKKFVSAGKTVSALYTYSQKIEKSDPKNMDWSKLQFIQNSELAAARVELGKLDAALDGALSRSVDWPDSGSTKAYADAMKAAAKYGKDAKETKAALDAYRRTLAVFDVELKKAVKALGDCLGEMRGRDQLAGDLAAYARDCGRVFLTLAKVPTFAGTAQNALFLSMSEDCIHIAANAGRVSKKFATLIQRTADAVDEGKGLIEQNQAWIAWSMRDAMKADDTLKRNERSVRPR